MPGEFTRTMLFFLCFQILLLIALTCYLLFWLQIRMHELLLTLVFSALPVFIYFNLKSAELEPGFWTRNGVQFVLVFTVSDMLFIGSLFGLQNIKIYRARSSWYRLLFFLAGWAFALGLAGMIEAVMIVSEVLRDYPDSSFKQAAVVVAGSLILMIPGAWLNSRLIRQYARMLISKDNENTQ